jgi:hypothetical protein
MGTVCQQCKREFLREECVASMSGSIIGDECTDSYYFCPVCQLYTLVSWHDNFTGIESKKVSGPISKQQGDESVVLIGQCECPWDKKCRCAAHLAYFHNMLD